MTSPLVEQFRKGGVSRDVRLTAAAGLLPLKPMDQAELFQLLTRDRDEAVRSKAEASLLEMKPESLQGVLKDGSANPKVLDFFGARLEDPELLELILQNAASQDQTIQALIPRLSHDRNRVVSSPVLNSPKITDSEIESFASMKNVSPEVLRVIGGKREWTKRYKVAHELVRNPLTPVEVAMRLLPRLPARDLKRLATDRNVPEAVRRQGTRLKPTP